MAWVTTRDLAMETRVAVATEERAAPGKGPGVAPLFPIALRVAGRTCVVIGGGLIASRKADDLLRAGARVRVVAPEWSVEFDRLAAGHDGAVERVTRRFEPRDL